MELARCSLILDKGKEGVGSSWSLLGHVFFFFSLVSFNMADCGALECLVRPYAFELLPPVSRSNCALMSNDNRSQLSVITDHRRYEHLSVAECLFLG